VVGTDWGWAGDDSGFGPRREPEGMGPEEGGGKATVMGAAKAAGVEGPDTLREQLH
jgi:hypothetical protein